MKIGIYGGTFNPVHYGHLRTAEEIYEIFSLDQVIFVPSGKPPFDKPDLAGARHRYRMVKTAIEGNRHFRVSGMEVNTRGKSYTIDTVTRLSEKYKGDELYFILGIDAFLDLPGWKQPDRLVTLANIIIMSRPGYSFNDLSSSAYARDVPKKIFKELDKGMKTVFPFRLSVKQRGFLCNVTGLNISASHIRSLIMSEREIKYLLPESVKSYIISYNLYKNNKNRKGQLL